MKSSIGWKLALIALVAVLLLAPVAGAQDADYVIFVSVDGMRADLLLDLVNNDSVGDFDTFRRLIDEGATTFNARTDYTHTVTIPNHVSMATARPVLQPEGQPDNVHHGYTNNGDPGADETLHNSGNPNVDYVASVFDVAHDHGLSTAMYASKSKFIIFDQSYDEDHGAADLILPDDGPDKIDTYVYMETGSPSNASNLHAVVMSDLAGNPARYNFVHYRDPDSAGHAGGWGSEVWNNSIRAVNDYLGDILDLIDSDITFQGRTTVIVTADHGGSGSGHGTATDPFNYTIPFLVWGAGVEAGTDLYALNATSRQDPGGGRPDYNETLQPIRHGDGCNLALDLLGLPPVSGSIINGGQELVVGLPPSPVVEVPRRSTTLALYPNPANPATSIDFTLSESGYVRLAVYTVSGRRVRTLADGQFPAGGHSVQFRDPALASGVYLVRLEALGISSGEKLLILK